MIDNRQTEGPPPIQHIRFAHPDGPAAQIEILRASELRQRRMSHSIYGPMRLNFHLLMLVLDGRGRHHVDFEALQLRKGSLLHIRPGQVHAFDGESTHEALLVVFLPEALSQPLPLELTRPHRPLVLRPRSKDFSLLVDLAQLLEDLPGRVDHLGPQHLGPHLLGALASATEQLTLTERALDGTVPSGTAGLVHRFEALLEEEHRNQRGVSWYASQLSVSPRTLARACELVLGTKPKRHIDARLALEAKRRLIYSRDRVEELSGILGFTEPTNFVKFFRRMTGQTPLEFRRLVL